MDNLSGKADYYRKGEKKKNKIEVVDVIVDQTELVNESKEIAEALNTLIVKGDALYVKFSKKQLNDMLTALRMAKGDLKKLMEA